MVQAICDDGSGRVIKARRFDRLRDREIGDTGLNHGNPIVEIDRADAIELRHAEQNAVAERQRAARQRGPGPARHHLDAFAVAIAEHFGDLRGGFRQHHDHRKLTVGGEFVALVRPHGEIGRDYALPRHDAPQRRDNFGAPRQHRTVGFGHCHGHRRVSGFATMTHRP